MSAAKACASGLLLLSLVTTGEARQGPVRDGGQPLPAVGRAEISGVVVSVDGNPLRGAHVSLANGPFGLQTVITDESGVFRFSALPPGRQSLTATKPAYLAAGYGAKRPGGPGTTIVVEDGQILSGITLKMFKGGVITGRIADERGRPLRDIEVSASRLGWRMGTQQPLGVNGGAATTDDRGVYRFFGLLPGDYIVRAVMPSGGNIYKLSASEIDAALNSQQQTPGPTTSGLRTFGTTPIYFPGTPVQENAVPLLVSVGEEKSGVDFALRMVSTARISGSVAGGPADATLRLSVVLNGGALGSTGRSLSINDPARSFQFVGIAPGHYHVTAKATSASGVMAAWASLELDVSDRNVDGVQLALQPTLQISGRVVFESSTSSPPYSDWLLAAMSVGPGPTNSGRAPINPDGTFAIQGLPPGRYNLYASGATPEVAVSRTWDLKAAMVGSIDAVDLPIDLPPGESITNVVATMTNQRSELTGKLQTLAGQAAPDFFVIAFPVNKAMWTGNSRYVRTVRPGSDGNFKFAGLPGADYYLAALVDVEDGEWTNPAFLESLVSAAAKVSLAAGEKKTQDLKIQK